MMTVGLNETSRINAICTFDYMPVKILCKVRLGALGLFWLFEFGIGTH